MGEVRTVRSIVSIGFFSFLCLLVAYLFTGSYRGSFFVIAGIVFSLATLQVFSQLIVFFNLTQEKTPSFGWILFWLTTLLMLILIIGSVWIMRHLGYNMMAV